MGRLNRAAADVSAGILLFFAAVCLVFSPPRRTGSTHAPVVCMFEDGPHTLSYREAYAALFGIAEDGAILLGTEGEAGRVETDEAFRSAAEILRHGQFPALYTLDMGAMEPLERAAVMQVFGRDVYYADGAFCITGDAVRLQEPLSAERVVLSAGALPRSYLEEVGAVALHLTAEAEFTADRLCGSKISEITADPPYISQGGALFLDTPGGRRLVAAVPTAETLAVGEYAFADRGALRGCTRLVSLTLPFLGNAKEETSDYRGDLRYLFETASEGTMPETLAYVTILGGKICAHAFYGCTLAEADLRRIPAEDLSPEAFTGASAMRIVCTRGDLVLSGYRVSAQGGLYTYEKEDV